MSTQIKKIIPYLLILIILIGVGIFGQAEKVNAVNGACFDPNGQRITLINLQTKADCLRANNSTRQTNFNQCAAQTFPFTDTNSGQTFNGIPDCAKYFGVTYWDDNATPTPTNLTPGTIPTTTTSGNAAFDNEVSQYGCGVFGSDTLLPGCLVQAAYYLLYVFPSLVLALAAYFFNILIGVTVNSAFLHSPFITEAWGVVRDLSNVFFILILLYIAIQIILDMGGHDAKKMIAKVLIIALLINFSMFFTQVIIDSSNILALIFYNKLKTTNTNYPSPMGDKDISGGLVSAFNPTGALSQPFFDEIKEKPLAFPWQSAPGPNEKKVPLGMLFGIIVTTGAIFLFAAYALFMSGMFFLGRLIELFVLIIFSPFAFMSSTVPLLSGASYIGWDAWFKRLLTVSFMAPIFMFFLYFIFMLVRAKMYEGILNQGNGVIVALLKMIIPAVLILILLLKATEYAKKGSGAFGETVMKAGGIALGLAAGGAAFVGSAGIGRVAGYAANKTAGGVNWLAKKDSWVGKTARGLGANKLASGLTGLGALAQRSSFDIRAGGFLSKATGLSLGEAQKGGVEQRRKDKVEKRMKRADMLKVRDDEHLKKALNRTEQDLQGLLNANAKELSELDKLIEKKRENLRDATARFGGGTPEAKAAGLELQNVKDRKKALKDGVNYAGDLNDAGVSTGANAKNYSDVNAGEYKDSAGVKHKRTINYMEDIELRDRKQDVETESRRRTTAFAKRTGRWYKGFAAKQAKHQIIMGSKVETKKDH